MSDNRSAVKRARQARERNLRNRIAKTRIKTEVRKYVSALSEDLANAPRQLGEASSVLDRAAAKGVIHKNAANRRKSRLARALNKARAGA